jgi:hypothetical protein
LILVVLSNSEKVNYSSCPMRAVIFGFSCCRQSEVKIENNFPAAEDKYDAHLVSTVAQAAKFHPRVGDLCQSSQAFVDKSDKK